jgi:hypothetical protein
MASAQAEADCGLLQSSGSIQKLEQSAANTSFGVKYMWHYFLFTLTSSQHLCASGIECF